MSEVSALRVVGAGACGAHVCCHALLTLLSAYSTGSYSAKILSMKVNLMQRQGFSGCQDHLFKVSLFAWPHAHHPWCKHHQGQVFMCEQRMPLACAAQPWQAGLA